MFGSLVKSMPSNNKMLQTVYTGLPVFLAVAIKGFVSFLVDEYMFITELHKIKMLVAFLKQLSRNIKIISFFIVSCAMFKVNTFRKFLENQVYVPQVETVECVKDEIKQFFITKRASDYAFGTLITQMF